MAYKESRQLQARNQDFMWGGGGGGGVGANEAKVDQTAECIFYCLIRLFRKVAIYEKL